MKQPKQTKKKCEDFSYFTVKIVANVCEDFSKIIDIFFLSYEWLQVLNAYKRPEMSQKTNSAGQIISTPHIRVNIFKERDIFVKIR